MLQPKLDLSCIIIELSRSCTDRHTHLVGFLWTGDQPIAEATFIHNTQQTQETNMECQTCDPSNQAAPNLRKRLHDQWDRLTIYYMRSYKSNLHQPKWVPVRCCNFISTLKLLQKTPTINLSSSHESKCHRLTAIRMLRSQCFGIWHHAVWHLSTKLHGVIHLKSVIFALTEWTMTCNMNCGLYWTWTISLCGRHKRF